jgi:hypothetical protein
MIQNIASTTSICPQIECLKPSCENFLGGKFQLEDGIQFKYSIFSRFYMHSIFKGLFVTAVLFVQNNVTNLFDLTNVFTFHSNYFYY